MLFLMFRLKYLWKRNLYWKTRLYLYYWKRSIHKLIVNWSFSDLNLYISHWMHSRRRSERDNRFVFLPFLFLFLTILRFEAILYIPLLPSTVFFFSSLLYPFLFFFYLKKLTSCMWKYYILLPKLYLLSFNTFI